ncbi:O-antigen ligase family protein [Sphingomonas sp. MMS24-J45]|uniref:O-antigen ligase family protein n=1 Tax=Sphingomonas sp. MMS24-J45 TaxID=3238806 RepID=UPI00384A579E
MTRNQPQSILPSLDLRGTALWQAVAVGGFLLLAVTLGGWSVAGGTANAVLQVASVIAIAATFARSKPTPRAGGERQLLLLVGLFGALFVLQLIPLPPVLWSSLPGRRLVVEGLAALGLPLPWMPLSLAPEKTVQSGLSLLPPLAMIVMIGAFRRPVARAAVLSLIALMILSVLLGVAQVAGNEHLYFYSFTNGGSAVGFFANSNHFATLMCLTLPLAAGLVARWRGEADGAGGVSRIFAAAVLLAVVLLGLLGVTMTKSVAGVGLALLSLAGSAAIVLSGLPRSLRLGFVGGVVLVVLIAMVVAINSGIGDLTTTDLGGGDLSRMSMWHLAIKAIGDFGTVGSGFGSFPQVFHLFENPERVISVFANHAHNDLLEFVLESGLPGTVLLLAFLVWFVLRIGSVWLIDRQRDPLAQGASVAALIVLLHSLADYPLRTGAIAAVFGLCLALLARDPAGRSSDENQAATQPGRHLSA